MESFVVSFGNLYHQIVVTEDMFVGNKMLFERCDCTVGVYYDDEKGKFVANIKHLRSGKSVTAESYTAVGVLKEVSYHADEFWKESFAGERVKKRLF